MEYMASSISSTFEGRDVFAHVAAHLASGVRLHELGPSCIEPVNISWGSFKIEPTSAGGEVLHTDWFGNITTNIPTSSITSWKSGNLVRVNIGPVSKIATMSETYCDVSDQLPLVIKGSGGFLEIAVNKGSASTLFNAKQDSIVTIDYEPAGT
jgi:S-adenosylmethionine hydrolase